MENEKIFTEKQVVRKIQAIYSEFAELPLSQQGMSSLRRVIEQEIEQCHINPLTIFNNRS